MLSRGPALRDAADDWPAATNTPRSTAGCRAHKPPNRQTEQRPCPSYINIESAACPPTHQREDQEGASTIKTLSILRPWPASSALLCAASYSHRKQASATDDRLAAVATKTQPPPTICLLLRSRFTPQTSLGKPDSRYSPLCIASSCASTGYPTQNLVSLPPFDRLLVTLRPVRHYLGPPITLCPPPPSLFSVPSSSHLPISLSGHKRRRAS